jgi:hypothetical protein
VYGRVNAWTITASIRFFVRFIGDSDHVASDDRNSADREE